MIIEYGLGNFSSRNFRHSFRHDLGTKSNKRLECCLGKGFKRVYFVLAFVITFLLAALIVSEMEDPDWFLIVVFLGTFLFDSIYDFQIFYMGFWCFHKKEKIGLRQNF